MNIDRAKPNMNILAFDTCFDACSVAIEYRRPDGSRAVVSERQFMATGHAEALVPMIARVVASAGLDIAHVDRIAVTHGPGTFTGTRIGIAAARALALAHAIPVVSFSSLLPIGMAAVQRLPDCSGEHDAVLVTRDARRGECYAEAVDAFGRSLTGPQLLTVEAAAALCPGWRLFVTGTAAEAVAMAGARTGRSMIVDAGSAEPAFAEADAVWLLGFAHAAAPHLTAPSPLYLRPPDAKPPASQSIPRRAAVDGGAAADVAAAGPTIGAGTGRR